MRQKSVGFIAGGILLVCLTILETACEHASVNREEVTTATVKSQTTSEKPEVSAALQEIASIKWETGNRETTDKLIDYINNPDYSSKVMVAAADALALRKDDRVFPVLLRTYARETVKHKGKGGFQERQTSMRLLGIIRIHYRVYPPAREAIQEFFWLVSFGSIRKENIWERWQMAYGMSYIGLEALQKVKIGLRIVR